MRDRDIFQEISSGAWSDFRLVWSRLLAIDVAYKLLAFVVLTPLVGLALRFGISLSGSSVLADQDILFFLLRPVGLVVLTLMGALFLTIVALEQACLMAIGVGAAEGHGANFTAALRFSIGRGRPVIHLALRLVARGLLLAAPFLAALALVYVYFLSDFDINYYLAESPPEFLQALGVAALIVSGLAWVLVPRLIGWSLALPLVLFESVPTGRALAESRERVQREWRPIAGVFIAWGSGAFLLSLTAPGVVAALARGVLPFAQGRPRLVLGLMLILVTLWLLINLLVSWAGAAAFALLVVRVYQRSSSSESLRLERSQRVELSPRRLLAGLAVLAVVVAGLGLVLLEGVRGADDAVVIAHRGAAGSRPENTMAAFAEALAQGADFVEIDVQETADGEVVVLHDSYLMKVAGLQLKIWDATWDQLEDVDIGSWFAPEFGGERVPRLGDVLELCRGRAKVNIELKYYGHDERLEERVVEIVERTASGAEVVVMSLKYEALKKMRALRPDWTLGLLTATAVGDLTKLDADFLAVATGLATPSFIRRAHGRGREVYVWTVNDPVQMFRMLNLGVDGLITDEPGLARDVIAERLELNSVERLLVGFAAFFGAAVPDPPTSRDAG